MFSAVIFVCQKKRKLENGIDDDDVEPSASKKVKGKADANMPSTDDKTRKEMPSIVLPATPSVCDQRIRSNDLSVAISGHGREAASCDRVRTDRAYDDRDKGYQWDSRHCSNQQGTTSDSQPDYS